MSIKTKLYSIYDYNNIPVSSRATFNDILATRQWVVDYSTNAISSISNYVDNIQAEVDGKADKSYVDGKVKTDVPDDAVFTDTIVDISGKADKVLPYTPLTGANVTVSPSGSYVWETTAGANLLTATGFSAGVDASCSIIITMLEGDTITASGLTFVDELEPGVNHCFIRQMPTGGVQLFVSYVKPFTPEQLERLEQYGDADIVPSPDAWFEFDPGTGTITNFNYAAGRENVVIPWEIGGVAVEAIGEMAFVADYTGHPIETLVGPKTLLSIGNGAFNGCGSLTSVSLPMATSVGGRAFSGCGLLTSVSLPMATSVGNSAFMSCASLTSVSLPMATSVGGRAFSNCASLTSVYFGTTKPSDAYDVFYSYGDPINATIYYPTGASAWSGVTTWGGQPTATYTPPAP